MVRNDDILTIPDIASVLKIADKTVYGVSQKNDLTGLKIVGHWRLRRAAIDSWIEEKTRATGAHWSKYGAKPSNGDKED